jgi:hypothetical protein
LAEITRLFNREFNYTPVTIIFKYNGHIAFANSERLKYKQEWREGEKIGKVSLLRDIDIENTHAGHIRILRELKIPKTGKNAVDSFEKLYKYWQEVFSVSILNKKFYNDLSNWYFWAIKHVTFPNKPTIEQVTEQTGKPDAQKLEELINEHNAQNVIRLLTRLLFTWFLKEKKLIPEALFDLQTLQKEILNDISPYHEDGTMFAEASKDSIYYKAILQNLFFASLNCPIEADGIDNRTRGFRGLETYGKHRGIDWMMRYMKYFKNPDAFLKLMNDTVPFLNGGLFECLDDKSLNIYIDGFSDQMTKDQRLIVPDYLFFGVEENVDLSADYGVQNKGTKQAAVKGLINILKSYKFTITENTPIEEDVELDPELLGKVFENLLASYNPETKTTARKQTGSFYTPREIVNYMVDESLIAYLKNVIGDNKFDEKELDEKLHQLLSYNPENPFESDAELTKTLILALGEVKILDPAVGSGAFPMGMLQKMVHLLQKLDPDNEAWKQVQLEKAMAETQEAFGIQDKEEREQKLIEINNAFDNRVNDPDFARKLYLIENCIYGVDIQPIATQISKLRFFISLVADQKVQPEEPNFGIRPLPNLETKFVTANTLIGIEKPDAQINLFETEAVKSLEAELKQIRHKLFNARTKETKLKYRQKDEELRHKIAEELKMIGWAGESAEKLAGWDPYDQNASSSFFDPEWMFDIKDGFDVVIGNPPYIGERKNKHVFLPIQNSVSKKYYLGRMDYFYFFFHKALDFLKQKGHCSFITTNYFITALGAKKLREDLKRRSQIVLIVNFNEAKVFDSAAGQHNMITLISKSSQQKNMRVKINDNNGLISENILSAFLTERTYKQIEPSKIWDGEENYLRISGNSGNSGISLVLNLIEENSTDLLGNVCKPLIGLESSLDDVYVQKCDFFKSIIESESELAFIKPFFKNSDINRYKIRRSTDRCILYLHEQIRDIKKLSGIYNYLLTYETDIKGRKGANLRGAFKRGNWWVLNTPRLDMNFSDEKIVTPYRSKSNTFAFSNDPWYASRDVYYIIKQKENIELKYILALLNSKLYFHWFYHRGKRKGETLELYAKPLKEVPIYEAPINKQKHISNLVSFIIHLADKGIDFKTFDSITEASVFNLYFPDHMQERGIDVLEFVERDIDAVMQNREFETLGDTEKESVIAQLHKTWTDPENEVVKRMAMFKEKSPDILKPILES